jgi:ABC-type nitrate/sulfonate/bicarbonate transport system substrate-binding protein
MRVTVTDAVTPSYFVATAAVELGYFKAEGIDAEFVYPPPADASQALRDGELDFYGCSPYVGLMAWPGWLGGKVLCALSRHTYWFLALVTSDRLVKGHPEAAAGAVRAIVKTQRALAADPSLATRAAERLFPAEEAGLIAELMARDVPFFDASISEETFNRTAQFAQDLGLLSGPVPYEQVVTTELRPLWTAVS